MCTGICCFLVNLLSNGQVFTREIDDFDNKALVSIRPHPSIEGPPSIEGCISTRCH